MGDLNPSILHNCDPYLLVTDSVNSISHSDSEIFEPDSLSRPYCFNPIFCLVVCSDNIFKCGLYADCSVNSSCSRNDPHVKLNINDVTLRPVFTETADSFMVFRKKTLPASNLWAGFDKKDWNHWCFTHFLSLSETLTVQTEKKVIYFWSVSHLRVAWIWL